MTLLQNIFEGGTDSTAVTTGNSGGVSGDAFGEIDTSTGLGTVAFTTVASHGGMALRSYGAGNRAFVGWSGIAAHTKFATRFYLRLPASPSAETQMFVVRNATAWVVGMNITATRTLRLTKGDGAAIYTSSALALDTWYRVEIRGEVGLTTSNGKVWFDVYLGDTGTSLGSYSSTAADLGTASLVNVRYGKQGASNTVETLWDSIAYNNAISTALGAYVPTLAVVRPSSVDDAGGWTNTGGTSLASVLADETDTTYAQSKAAPTSDDPFTVSLNGTLAPGAVTVTTRAQADTASPATTLKVELLQGATVIASRTFNMTASWADYSFTTTSGETAAITDRTILKVRNTANQP